MTSKLDVNKLFENKSLEISDVEHDDDRRARIALEDRADRARHNRDSVLFYVLLLSYGIFFVLSMYLLWRNDFNVESQQGKLGWLIVTNLLTAFLSSLAAFKVGQKGK
jgi:hypothetical protein